MADNPSDRAPAVLSTMPWKQRPLLDLLQFKMEQRRLLPAHGPARWVAGEPSVAEVSQLALAESIQ